MGWPEGNNYNLKYKTPEERKEICRQLCEHLREGFSFNCFPPLSHNAIRRYIEAYPDDMNSSDIDQAYREGIHGYEKIGNDAIKGLIPGFQNGAYNLIMRNKAGWIDKSDQNEIPVVPEIKITLTQPEKEKDADTD